MTAADSGIVPMTDLERIQSAFISLEAQGIACRGGDWICCQTCGHAAMQADGHERYVFWHAQDDDAAFRDPRDRLPDELFDELGNAIDEEAADRAWDGLHKSDLVDDLHFAYGPDESVAQTLVVALQEVGFEIQWDGLFEHRPSIVVDQDNVAAS